MNVLKKSSIFFLLVFGLYANGQQADLSTVKAEWMSDDYIDEVQILLSNYYELGPSTGYGASSFLVESDTATYLCTAKHLLGPAMGIEPEVSTKDFNQKLELWIAFPRADKITADTIRVKELITEEINEADAILLSVNLAEDHRVQSLKARFDSIPEGEPLFVIGCEYSDSDCHQKSYPAVMSSYPFGKIMIKLEQDFDASGFSGAPVIDANGFVVGILIGGGIGVQGDFKLTLEPMTSLKKWLVD